MCMKKVLIIGGNCDIGKYLVNYFLDNNYEVFVGYHNDNNEYFKKVNYVKCNVSDADSIESIIKYGIDTYGKIDILVNNLILRSQQKMYQLHNPRF